jgi:hypothetical protein
MSRFLCLLLLLAIAPPASAHEYWLAPSSHAPRTGEVVEMGALAGTGFRGERKPWSSARCVRLVAHVARTLDLAPLGQSGEIVWARFAPRDGGGAMLAYESSFTSIELPAPEFERYLRLEGLDGPLAARIHGDPDAKGRERYRRCAKAWLAGSDAGRATAPIGMPLEIVPLATPGEAPSLIVRLLWRGRPLTGALLKAWRAPLGSDPERRDSVAVAWQARTDARGEARVPAAVTGEWLVAAVHMEPCAERAAADWESTWASLTFARRDAR